MRTYKRKRDPRGRMLRAVELAAEGKSTREIAAVLGCSHDTVWRDLRKWEAERKTASLSDRAVRKPPPWGENLTAGSDTGSLPDGQVVPLRRIS